MSDRLSERSIFSIIEPASTRVANIDIGGETNNSAYVAMKNFARVVQFNELGTWSGSDDLDQCKMQQATTSGGGDVKDLTSSSSGGNYDTANPVDADGNFVIIEARGEDLDSNATATVNAFDFVRALVTEDDNTAQDDLWGMLVRYDSSYMKKELQGEASTGAQVYVDTGT